MPSIYRVYLSTYLTLLAYLARRPFVLHKDSSRLQGPAATTQIFNSEVQVLSQYTGTGRSEPVYLLACWPPPPVAGGWLEGKNDLVKGPLQDIASILKYLNNEPSSLSCISHLTTYELGEPTATLKTMLSVTYHLELHNAITVYCTCHFFTNKGL